MRNLKVKPQDSIKSKLVLDTKPSGLISNMPANSLTMLNKQLSLKTNLSLNWHDYAEMRKSYLPTIFNSKEKADYNDIKPELNKGRNKKHARSL